MTTLQILGALLVASPFIAMAVWWVRDFGWRDFGVHLAALLGLGLVIGLGIVLMTGVSPWAS